MADRKRYPSENLKDLQTSWNKSSFWKQLLKDNVSGVTDMAQAFNQDPLGVAASSFDPRPVPVDSTEWANAPTGWDRVALALGSGAPLMGMAGMPKAGKPTVRNPKRVSFPRIYDNPKTLWKDAAAQADPESPLLHRLFGVHREDLTAVAKNRVGNVSGGFPELAKNPQGSPHMLDLDTPANTKRMLDMFDAGREVAPKLFDDALGWYVQDPMFQRMVRLLGKQKAIEMYNRLNTFSGIESAMSSVQPEFVRGTAANWLAENGRWTDWEAFGGLGVDDKVALGSALPHDMVDVPGRVGWRQTTKKQGDFLRTGVNPVKSAKEYNYILASGVPDTGFQTDVPVGDRHLVRASGAADVRPTAKPDASLSTPEANTILPWQRSVYKKAGVEPVSGQAIVWTGFGPATGVKTALGLPKLELQALEIEKAARRLGVSPEMARDLILTGQTHAGGGDGPSWAEIQARIRQQQARPRRRGK